MAKGRKPDIKIKGRKPDIKIIEEICLENIDFLTDRITEICADNIRAQSDKIIEGFYPRTLIDKISEIENICHVDKIRHLYLYIDNVNTIEIRSLNFIPRVVTSYCREKSKELVEKYPDLLSQYKVMKERCEEAKQEVINLFKSEVTKEELYNFYPLIGKLCSVYGRASERGRIVSKFKKDIPERIQRDLPNLRSIIAFYELNKDKV